MKCGALISMGEGEGGKMMTKRARRRNHDEEGENRMTSW